MKPTYQSPGSSENITSLGLAVGQLITTFLLLEMEAYIEGQRVLRSRKEKKGPKYFNRPCKYGTQIQFWNGRHGAGKS